MTQTNDYTVYILDGWIVTKVGCLALSKIGYSRNPSKRFKQICHVEWKRGFLDGIDSDANLMFTGLSKPEAVHLEATLHEAFGFLSMGGEWFAFPEETRESIVWVSGEFYHKKATVVRPTVDRTHLFKGYFKGLKNRSPLNIGV